MLLILFPILWVVGWRLPSTDMIGFSKINSLSVQFLNGDLEVENAALQFRQSVPDYEDFTVTFTLSNNAVSTLKAKILLPPEDVLSLRTNDRCPSDMHLVKDLAAACAFRISNRPLSVKWLATPHRPAVTHLVISSKDLKLDEYPLGTTVSVFIGEKQYCEYRNADGNAWSMGSTRIGIKCVPVQLGQKRTQLVLGSSKIQNDVSQGIRIDVSKGEIDFTVDIQTTLGISRGTYSWLALIGALISGFLGSGWLWKLLDARSNSRDNAA